MDDETMPSVSGASDAAASGPVENGDSRTLDDLYAVLVEIRDSGAAAALSPDSQVVTVALEGSQYDCFSALGGAGLQVGVLSVGVLALVLGAVIATAMTLHWRGSRG